MSKDFLTSQAKICSCKKSRFAPMKTSNLNCIGFSMLPCPLFTVSRELMNCKDFEIFQFDLVSNIDFVNICDYLGNSRQRSFADKLLAEVLTLRMQV